MNLNKEYEKLHQSTKDYNDNVRLYNIRRKRCFWNCVEIFFVIGFVGSFILRMIRLSKEN